MNDNSKRSVDANELLSTELPRLRVQIDSSLAYLGNFNSTVLDSTQIDNYYFVDKNADGQIQRVLYFQFEGFLPDNDQTFNYPNMQAIDINGQDFAYDGGVRAFRHAKVEEQADNSDVRQTVNFLKQHQAHFTEGEFYAMLRFAKVLDKARNDLLIIYLERLEEADIPEDVLAKSRYSDEWSDYCQQVLARALRVFTICD